MRPWAAEKAGLRRDAYGAVASHHFEGAATHRGQTEAPARGCAFAQTRRTDVGLSGIPPADKQKSRAQATALRGGPFFAGVCRPLCGLHTPAKLDGRKAAHWAAFLPIKRAACPMFGTNRPACVAGGAKRCPRGGFPRADSASPVCSVKNVCRKLRAGPALVPQDAAFPERQNADRPRRAVA